MTDVKKYILKYRYGLLAFIIFLSAGLFFWFKYYSTAGYLKVESYTKVTGTRCQALIPECGYCPGRIISGDCYVSKNSSYRDL
jgi:hypothetical protein